MVSEATVIILVELTSRDRDHDPHRGSILLLVYCIMR